MEQPLQRGASRPAEWRRALLPLLAALLLLPAGLTAARPESPVAEKEPYGSTPEELRPYGQSDAPYRTFYTEPLAYNGPGRAYPEPTGLASVRIGLITPLGYVAEHENGLGLRRGVEMAVAEANAGGGYRNLPFEIVLRPDQALWGSSANTVIDLAYNEQVWAIIGSIDANTTHVALRVAFKAEVAMLNVGSGDPTMTETGIPWIARTTPDDRQTSYRLAELLFNEMDLSRVAVLRSNNRYGRFGIREFRDAARRLQRPLPLEVQFPPQETDFTSALDRVLASDPQAVVLWARAPEAARALRQLRARGIQLPVAGTDRLASRLFLQLAGPDAEGVMATSWLAPGRQDQVWLEFAGRYRELHGEEPEAFAAYGYDAAGMVIEAVRRQGLNRARIRDHLMGIRRHEGVAGTVVMSPTANSITPPHLVQVKQGRLVELTGPAPLHDPVRIGVVVGDDPWSRALAAGAAQAAETIHERGGINGRQLELVPLATARPWQDGAGRIARLAAGQETVALLTGNDGASAHLAAQVASRLRLPMVTASPEVSLTQAGAPWVFRAVDDDHRQAAKLLQQIPGDPGSRRAVLVVPGGREGRERSRAVSAACRQAGVPLVRTLEFSGDIPPIPKERDVLLLWLDAGPARDLLLAWSPQASFAMVLGSTRLNHPDVLDLIPARDDIFILAGASADWPGALGRDMVNLMAAALSQQGPDPGALREALATMKPFHGETGVLAFDEHGNLLGQALQIAHTAERREHP